MGDQEHLPNERFSITKKLEIVGKIDGYVHIGAYDDGRIGEIGLVFGQKHGDEFRGFLDAISASVSIGLQHGVPLSKFVSKFSRTRFEPCGMTTERAIPQASSILDLIFRWIGKRFPDGKILLEKSSAGE
jgi:ribonucleoside-diphosphate reductase alpha chain